MNNQLSLDALCHSDIAIRRSLDNTPPPWAIANLRILLDVLQRVQASIGVPLIVTSGYRCPELNALIGGAKNSAHSAGFAADFRAPNFGTARELARHIAGMNIIYDQLIYEGTWVHLGLAPSPRYQTLTAHFTNRGTKYTQGLA